MLLDHFKTSEGMHPLTDLCRLPLWEKLRCQCAWWAKRSECVFSRCRLEQSRWVDCWTPSANHTAHRKTPAKETALSCFFSQESRISSPALSFTQDESAVMLVLPLAANVSKTDVKVIISTRSIQVLELENLWKNSTRRSQWLGQHQSCTLIDSESFQVTIGAETAIRESLHEDVDPGRSPWYIVDSTLEVGCNESCTRIVFFKTVFFFFYSEVLLRAGVCAMPCRSPILEIIVAHSLGGSSMTSMKRENRFFSISTFTLRISVIFWWKCSWNSLRFAKKNW